MKVYSCPAELPAPQPDYRNFDHKKELAEEEAHIKALKAEFIKRGYTGKFTGEIVRFPVADGHAQYMFIAAPTVAKSFLIHLPYGDAWSYREVTFLPHKEITKRIKQAKEWEAIFAKGE